MEFLRVRKFELLLPRIIEKFNDYDGSRQSWIISTTYLFFEIKDREERILRKQKKKLKYKATDA